MCARIIHAQSCNWLYKISSGEAEVRVPRLTIILTHEGQDVEVGVS